MARPRKGEELRATRFIGARVPDELRQCLEQMAKENGRALTDEVRDALERHCKRGRRAAG